METQEHVNMLTSDSVMKLMAEKIDHEKMKLDKVEIYHPCDRFCLMVRVIAIIKAEDQGHGGFRYLVAEEMLDEGANKNPFILTDYKKLTGKLVEKLNESSR